MDEAVTTGTSDMSSQISKIKAANPDVINVSFYTPEMIIFDKALMANKVNPPFGVWSVGGGNQDPAYFDSVDASVYDYHFVQEDWNVSMPYLYDWAGELNEKVKAEKGYGLNSFFAQGWTAAYVAYDALEAAGSSDKGAIRDALAGLELTLNEDDHTLLSGYPGLKFDENGQNTMSTGTMVQYQKGVAIPFSPTSNLLPGYSLDDIIVPIPDDFADRGKDAKPWGTPPEVRQ
ncbi:ABC transporter substrate-binding protein [Clostridium sp. AM58-1XD]|uniref:ABC transporter substrate-binding protein n=1 Tax=Clostridium sp. AM58-1XD TaxID=2292307 RepID=UPI000E4E9DBD|nr:ABC transporter substrate-binding protein [Clostridium sp. AM58-1XD]RGY99941.1 hypothetical protein DXA13_06970 [Clostridium sp. AM58-1XD]